MTYEERKSAYAVEWNAFKEEVRSQYSIDRAMQDFGSVVFSGPRSGDMKVSCPFHEDKKPSMAVNISKGVFHCFSSGCNAGGDVFAYIKEYEGVSFKDAVILAGHQLGITPPTWSGEYNRVPVAKKSNAPRNLVESEMNPSRLWESDLERAFVGIGQPIPDQFFKVWRPAGGTVPVACVKTYKPKLVHIYRDMKNFPIQLILRCEHTAYDKENMPDVSKYFIPLRVGAIPKDAPRNVVGDKENGFGWIVKGTTAGHRKPIYGIEKSPQWFAKNGNRILIVEGEKTRDAALEMISSLDDAAQWLVLSPMGGGGAALYADWTDFMQMYAEYMPADVTFSVWPDADHIKKPKRHTTQEVDAQENYVRDTIGAFVTAMRKAGIDPTDVRYTRALPGYDREHGWDLADAKKEGWTGQDILEHIEEKGAKMPIEKRFLELDVAPAGDDEITPFEDGPEAYEAPQGHEFEYDDVSDADAKVAVAGDDFINPHADDVVTNISPLDELMGGPAPEMHMIERVIEEADVVDLGHNFDPSMLRDRNNLIENDEDVSDNQDEIAKIMLQRCRFFRPLGYLDTVNYFMSQSSGQIFGIQYTNMKKLTFLSLAPISFWEDAFGVPDRNNQIMVNWDRATSGMIELSYDAGIFNPQKVAGQGARIDQGRVVFSTGDRLWVQNEVDGDGLVQDASTFDGEYHYTIGKSCGLPNFSRSFNEGDPEPLQLLDLIKQFNWRSGTSSLSVMALFGWLCVGPICGVLPWRPHLWLDGQRSSGKSWLIQNIIQPALGDYALQVKSNSTESGLRNMLNSRAFPLVFDEAEGEMDGDRNRMAAVLKLARHSATPGDSVVAQGIAGGAGQRFFSIASTFLLASITPQIESSADVTRFARARLGKGHDLEVFSKKIEQPAMDLLTPEFSSRLIARMVKRAGAIMPVSKLMVRAFTACNIERRLADVWGVYAAGAWLLLKDGVPKDFEEAMEFIDEYFGVFGEIGNEAAEISDDKDHMRLLRTIMASEVRCETLHMGVRTFSVGSLLDMAICDEHADEDPEVLSMTAARKRLADIGIRPAFFDREKNKLSPSKENHPVEGLLIHKASPRIVEMLKNSPYKTSYIDVVQQAENTKAGPNTRFGGLGLYRSVFIPLESFQVQEDAA